MYRSGDRSRSSEGRQNSFSEDLSEIYGGPTDFMEFGARGFLVTTLPKKEEFGVDDAIDLLRQTSIKLYGGYKPAGLNSKNLERQGYVKVICLDIDAIKVHPHPGGEEEEEAEASKDVNMEKSVEEQDEKKDESGNTADKTEESEKDGAEEKEDKKDDNSTESKEEKTKEEQKKEEEKQEKKNEEEEEKRKDSTIPRMHSIYKFIAYRTEMRNILFIKSDVPDPVELAEGAMELVLQRKSVTGDAVCQLMPVLGVCQYDYQQLEVMCRRTLAPIFDEALEPKSFGVMLIDKLSEPGSEVVYETVRNTIWSVNPLAWMSSPISEPDVVLRFELIGTKLVLSCLRNYMRYRQYSPTLLVDMGRGEAEDDDGGWMSEEAKKQLAQKRLEKEKQREQERLKEIERQKERAKRQEEAEARRKTREEERKKREEERRERREKERKERDEKEKANSKGKSGEKSEKNESSKKEETEEESEVKENAEEDTETPPSKKQRTDSKEKEPDEEETVSKEDETNEEEELETSVTEETPPSKKQRVDSSIEEISKEDEELLLADDLKEEQEKEPEGEQEESEDTSLKNTPKRATRATRKTRGRASKK